MSTVHYFLYCGLCASLLICFSCQPSSSKEASKDYIETAHSGKELYGMYCIACHGADGTLQLSGATDLTISSLSLNDRINQIKQGKGAMIGFENRLTEEEIGNVALYIETLRKE